MWGIGEESSTQRRLARAKWAMCSKLSVESDDSHSDNFDSASDLNFPLAEPVLRSISCWLCPASQCPYSECENNMFVSLKTQISHKLYQRFESKLAIDMESRHDWHDFNFLYWSSYFFQCNLWRLARPISPNLKIKLDIWDDSQRVISILRSWVKAKLDILRGSFVPLLPSPQYLEMILNSSPLKFLLRAGSLEPMKSEESTRTTQQRQ